MIAGQSGDCPRLHAGTYGRNGGAGLRTLIRDSRGSWSLGPAFAQAANASFAAFAPRYRLVYLVDEEAGALNVLRDVGGWERLARVPTLGEQPCYVALAPDQGWLAVANYASGGIALWRLDRSSGLPIDPLQTRQREGSGPVVDRQDGPHAHCACFGLDGPRLYHVDLGTDEVVAYAFDPESGLLGEAVRAYGAPAGSGPRHLVFHPQVPRALLVSELASSLTVLDVAGGLLTPTQIVSTLPAGFAGNSLGGHLSLNAAGDRAYVTNRGHDSIAVFAWDDDGLELMQHVPSGGASPRAFVLLEAERQLALANEEGGSVTFFDLKDDGTLSRTGPALSLPGAVFLLAGTNLSPKQERIHVPSR